MRRAILLACLLLGIAACAGSAQTVLSMQAIESSMTGSAAEAALKREAGVRAVRFERATAELHVDYDPARIDPARLAAVVQGVVQAAVHIGAGQGSYRAEADWPAGADVQIIRDPATPLVPVPGKATVFDFYATWCVPCRAVDARLRQLAAAGVPLAVRKIDIGDWDSPMARAHLGGIEELPHLRVHGLDGALKAQITGLDLARLERVVRAAAAR